MFTVFFEEEESSANLHPLNYFRSNVELRTGGYTLLDKWKDRMTLEDFYILTRPYLQDYTDEVLGQSWIENNADDTLWINSQIVPNLPLVEEVSTLKPDEALFDNGRLIAVKTKQREKALAFPGQYASGLRGKNTNAVWVDYPWDLVELNGAEIANDKNIFLSRISEFEKNPPGVEIVGKEDVYISSSAKIYPMVVLNAEKGPIFIENNVNILPFSYIEGPAFVGENSMLKPNTRLLNGSTLGPHCKGSGEISNSIFHSFSNKQHDGFLGNSYLSPWVNLGADTNNSNLKNNYLNVKVPINGKEIDTGLLFAGLFAGDHAKSAINTMFNTGTVLGCFANVYGADFPSKFIPNFAWGNKKPFMTYHLNKAIKTAGTVKSRRNKTISKTEEELIRHVFASTAKDNPKET